MIVARNSLLFLTSKTSILLEHSFLWMIWNRSNAAFSPKCAPGKGVKQVPGGAIHALWVHDSAWQGCGPGQHPGSSRVFCSSFLIWTLYFSAFDFLWDAVATTVPSPFGVFLLSFALATFLLLHCGLNLAFRSSRQNSNFYNHSFLSGY